MTLSIQDLFTPDPSGVDAENPNVAPPPGSWYATLINLGVAVNLAVTDWNSGGVTRAWMEIMSLALAGMDQILSTDLQGGLLDWAAAVTDDPASLGTAARPGWLDALADGNYDVQREDATYAQGAETVANASASTYGPFAPGTYHIANGTTGAGYTNVESLTIAPGTMSATFRADLSGTVGTSTPGTIATPVTALVGVTVTNSGSFVGSNPESNASLVARCRAKFASLSPNGPEDAYRFFATSAFLLIKQVTSLIAMSQPVTQALVTADTDTGVVTVTVANAAGAVAGVVNELITGATNTSPIVLSASTSGLNIGDPVIVSGVRGNTAANGFWTIGAASFTGSTMSLVGSAGNGAYTSGGVLEGGDLGIVDYIIRSKCVPLTVSDVVQSASDLLTTVVVTLFVPAASAATTATVAQTSITSYFKGIPIGGFATGVVTPNTVPIAGLLAAITSALSAQHITPSDSSATLNGSGADMAVGATQIPRISGTPTVNVVAT